MNRIICILFAGLSFLAGQSPASAQSAITKPLSIEDTITLALENNQDILNAKEEVSRAGYRIMEATSGALPQINGFMNTQRTLKQQVFIIQFPDSTGSVHENRLKVGSTYNVSLGTSLTQPLYVGGKVGTARQAAQIYSNISDDALKNVQQNVVMGVVQAFNGVLLAREVNRISLESLAQAEKHLANVQNLFNAGTATEYDLLRARVNATNLRPNVINSENNIQLALLNLKRIMGIDPDLPIDIDGVLAEPDTTLLKTASSAVAFQNRPDLLASQQSVSLYEKNVKLVHGDFLPTLTAGTTFMYMGNFDVLRYRGKDWTPYWYATINLSFPIFDGFNTLARYRQAKVDHMKAQNDYSKLQDATDVEVKGAVMSLQRAIDTINSQKLNIQEAERAVQLSESRYTSGAATQLEVLDTQLALSIANNNMANALYVGRNAEITLRKSLGLITINSGEN